MDRAHFGERRLHLGAPQADVLDGRHDARKQPRSIRRHHLRAHHRLDALLGIEPEIGPQLDLVEAVAHVIAGFDHELLALGALGVGEFRIVVAQRDAAEGDVARFVLHHIRIDRGGQRMAGGVANALEGGQRQAFDQDLHAKEGHVPARVGQHLLQQGLQPRGQRIDQVELVVQQARIRLDVARLVHGLGRGIELRVHRRHHVHQLGGDHQRALLAVHELGQRVRLLMVADVDAILLRQLVPQRRAEDRDRAVVEQLRIFRVEILRPVDAQRGVPLPALALVVEVEQVAALVLVFPGKRRFLLLADGPAGDVDRQRVAVQGGHADLVSIE